MTKDTAADTITSQNTSAQDTSAQDAAEGERTGQDAEPQPQTSSQDPAEGRREGEGQGERQTS